MFGGLLPFSFWGFFATGCFKSGLDLTERLADVHHKALAWFMICFNII